MTTAKELLHSNDHIKRIGPGKERETSWYPPLVETRHLNPNINTVPMATTTPDQNT